MAIDTLMIYAGVYGSVQDAESDYELVKELHREAGLIDGYDAAVIERREGGKVERAMKRAEKLQEKQLKADNAEIERDAKASA